MYPDDVMVQTADDTLLLLGNRQPVDVLRATAKHLPEIVADDVEKGGNT